ncbi:MAG: hypothetical protein JW709_06520 [Sedimentisphaerales bacterium]|nr:hypothetical protein [Sedimentisphaerales bacterium]
MKFWASVLISLSLFIIGGCIVVSDNKCPCRPCPPPPAKAPCAMDAEIQAVAGLNLENSRIDRYCALAGRTPLSPAAQVSLIAAACDNLHLEANVLRLFKTVINNPDLCPAGKRAILDRLDYLHLENNRREVLDALDRVAVHPSEQTTS